MDTRLSLRPNGKHRKQRSGDYSVTINGLMTCRSLLISEKPATLSADIAVIDSALKLLGFDEDPQSYMPARRKKSIFSKGEKIRLIRQVLKQADKPLTSREITIAILSAKDFDMADKGRLKQTTTGVYIVLCREVSLGRVRVEEGHPKMFYRAHNL